jgi:hypothetical protein
MEWYDKLSDKLVERLKSNTQALVFCAWWLQEAFKKMPMADRDFLCMDGNWCTDCDNKTEPGYVYRLRPDWQRPAKPEPKEKGRREEWEVSFCNGVYTVCTSAGQCLPLRVITNYKVMGYQFKEWPGRWFAWPTELVRPNEADSYAYKNNAEFMASSRPATLTKVMVWVESDNV